MYLKLLLDHGPVYIRVHYNVHTHVGYIVCRHQVHRLGDTRVLGSFEIVKSINIKKRTKMVNYTYSRSFIIYVKQ